MKLKTLIDITPALSALAATKLPAKTSYRVAKAINAAKPELAAYDEARIKLAAELGTLSADGHRYEFSADNAPVFSAQHAALLDEDCAVALPTITPDDLGNAEIEAQHIAALLDTFIVETKEN